ncbi:cell division protein PerM [Actinomycetospora endophytica]|uniref:cell division protein PerM n=1 Tax=Actinomycetospora endophytica TaxID=2291215 RepID=UPI0027E39162|nr:DUF6350 family protein [Actinomycetospora endophytica]
MLVQVAVVPVLVTYAAVVVLAALITASASGTSPGGDPGLGQALGSGVPLWLAVHLVPLTVSGAPLGMLPLAPAIGVAFLVGALARRGVTRLGELADEPTSRSERWPTQGVPVVAAAAAVHAAAGVLAAALLTPDTATIPADASPGTAGLVAGLLAAVSAAVGVAARCGLPEGVRALPGWVLRGVRAGLGAAAGLVAGGAALLLVVLLARADAVARSFAAIAPQAGSGAGLWFLDAAYLPNAAAAAVSWLLGPGYEVGAMAASPTSATPGLLPPVPLAALLPTGPPPTWAGLVFAVPLAVGSLVGWVLATGEPEGSRGPVGSGRAGRDLLVRVRPVLMAALTAGVVLAVAAVLAGGRLGSGPFDPVVVPAGGVLLAVLGWIALPGAVVALLAAPTGAPARRERAASSSEEPTTAAEATAVVGDPAGAEDTAGAEEEAAAEDVTDGTDDEDDATEHEDGAAAERDGAGRSD